MEDPADDKVMEDLEDGKELEDPVDDKVMEDPEDEKEEKVEAPKAPIFVLKIVNGEPKVVPTVFE